MGYDRPLNRGRSQSSLYPKKSMIFLATAHISDETYTKSVGEELGEQWPEKGRF